MRAMRLIPLNCVAALIAGPLVGDSFAQPSSLNAAEVFKKTSPAVVTIVTASAQGSGVLVDSSGLVVTNLHVVQGETQATIKLANGDAYDSVEVSEVDSRKDVVLLKIKGFKLPYAELGDSDSVVIGQATFAIGTPQGMELSISEGIVSAVRDSGDGYRVIQTTAAISPGSSGGGLFDNAGRLVGITSFKLRGGEALNFAVPINYVRGMLGGASRLTLAELATKYPKPQSETLPAASASNSVPRLARGYTSGSNFAMFEPRPDGSVYASFSTASGVVYGSSTLQWDKDKKAFIGRGTIKTVCGQVDTRIWDAPIVDEVYVISDGFIRERWTQPTRVNCSKRQVLNFLWQEGIWYVPR